MIVGDKDFLGAGGSVKLQRGIAGAGLTIVPRRGHGIFLGDPEGFSALLRTFLDGLASARWSDSSGDPLTLALWLRERARVRGSPKKE